MSIQRIPALDDYQTLGTSGFRISPFCLGTKTFGTDWGWGADKPESRKIFDFYVDHGGNFIDTASYYTNGTSETRLGEFIGKRRPQLVIGTQYTIGKRSNNINSSGNQRKNMVQSLEASLRRLRTDYVDLFWLHCWDFSMPIDAVMRALDDLVQLGKVLHVGISNTPAWKIAQGNAIAYLRGWTPFVGIQAEYNLTERWAEHDLIPMADEMNIGVLAVSPLAGGVLTGKYTASQAQTLHLEMAVAGDRGSARASVNRAIGLVNGRNLAIAAEVVKLARQVGRSPAQVALNWMIQRAETAGIILGARTCKQLAENLDCLSMELTPTQMFELDRVSQTQHSSCHRYQFNI